MPLDLLSASYFKLVGSRCVCPLVWRHGLEIVIRERRWSAHEMSVCATDCSVSGWGYLLSRCQSRRLPRWCPAGWGGRNFVWGRCAYSTVVLGGCFVYGKMPFIYFYDYLPVQMTAHFVATIMPYARIQLCCLPGQFCLSRDF